jgi:hypothetical protein
MSDSLNEQNKLNKINKQKENLIKKYDNTQMADIIINLNEMLEKQLNIITDVVNINKKIDDELKYCRNNSSLLFKFNILFIVLLILQIIYIINSQ